MAICRLADHFDCRSTARAVDFEIRYIKRGKKYIEFGKRSIRMFAGGEGAEGKFGQTVHVRVFPVNWFSWLRVLSAILGASRKKRNSVRHWFENLCVSTLLLCQMRFVLSFREQWEGINGGRKVSKIAKFYFEIPRGTTLVSCRMLNTIKERNEMTRFSFRFLLVSLLIIADSLLEF